jgi:hypothetical protein
LPADRWWVGSIPGSSHRYADTPWGARRDLRACASPCSPLVFNPIGERLGSGVWHWRGFIAGVDTPKGAAMSALGNPRCAKVADPIGEHRRISGELADSEFVTPC